MKVVTRLLLSAYCSSLEPLLLVVVVIMLAALWSCCRPNRELLVIFSCLAISIYFIIGTAPNISNAIQKLHPEDDAADEAIAPVFDHQDAQDAIWQNVAGTKHKFFVYSAYHEMRKIGTQGRCVRVLSASHTIQSRKQPLWCRLWFSQQPNTNNTLLVKAKVQIIRENNRLKYSASFVFCPLRPDMDIPHSVSIISNLQEPPTNQLRVNNNLLQQHTPETLSVCVKPFYNYVNKSLAMIEFIEMYRLLGATHFTLYNHSADPETECILRHYTEQRVVDVLPWQLDLRSQIDIRTENIFGAINDCLYRNMYRYSNVAMVDFDEFIIPRNKDTLVEFVDWMDQKNSKRIPGSYIFRNAFFYRQFPSDVTTTGNDPLARHLLTVTKTRRKSALLPHKQRSKYICKPELVLEVGNHFVWQHVRGVTSINVSDQLGLSHHYRSCEFGGDSCIEEASVVDNMAHKYQKRLVDNVGKVWTELRDRCNLQNFGSRR